MQAKLYKQLHTNVFSEIIKGKYNPCLEHNNEIEALRNFVFAAHTIKVAALPAEADPMDYIENTDFTGYGYHDNRDVLHEVHKRPSGIQDVTIRPRQMYDLNESIDLPSFVSAKCNAYVEFMGDEFERIKIRAEKILSSGTKDSAVKEYASRHVQILKKLFYEAKLILNNVQKEDKPDDVYIIFAANLFLIRLILFYQKFFKIYLPGSPDAEEKLFNEVIQAVSLKKLCYLFQCGKSSYGDYLKKTYTGKPSDSESEARECQADQYKTFQDKKSLPVPQRTAKYDPIKVNGQVNVFVDFFVQLLEEYETPDGPMIETTRENLEKFIVANFLDKKGKPFNPFTVNTLLKSYRTDKHISVESPKRLDTQKMSRRKKDK